MNILDLPELLARCDGSFIPRKLDDFIGRQIIERQSGDTWIGARLVAYLKHLLGCNKWNTTKLNGTPCKIDAIGEIARQLAGTSLFGDWHLLWIDEADAIPPVAQVRFLTLLDYLPRGIAIACTSNCRLRDFEERFQTRFQAFEIAPPSTEEIISLLRRYLPDEPEVVNAARFADGNVRQALLDAKALVQRSIQLIAA